MESISFPINSATEPVELNIFLLGTIMGLSTVEGRKKRHSMCRISQTLGTEIEIVERL